MKTTDIKDAAKKKASKKVKVIDIKEYAKKKTVHTGKIKKLQDARNMARKMGINTRNVTLTELIRAIQRAEGNKDCYMSAHVLTCEEKSCFWREYCEPT